MSKNINDPRRAFLVDALSIGLFTSANIAGYFQASRTMGDIPFAKFKGGKANDGSGFYQENILLGRFFRRRVNINFFKQWVERFLVRYFVAGD